MLKKRAGGRKTKEAGGKYKNLRSFLLYPLLERWLASSPARASEEGTKNAFRETDR
jgi:hypothetical protein